MKNLLPTKEFVQKVKIQRPNLLNINTDREDGIEARRVNLLADWSQCLSYDDKDG